MKDEGGEEPEQVPVGSLNITASPKQLGLRNLDINVADIISYTRRNTSKFVPLVQRVGKVVLRVAAIAYVIFAVAVTTFFLAVCLTKPLSSSIVLNLLLISLKS